jgi:hypothetical protein
VVQEIRKGWTFRKRHWKGPECNNGIKDRPKTAAVRQHANKGSRRQSASFFFVYLRRQETIRDSIKFSAKESLGYYEPKKNKSWFDEGC